MNGFTSPRGRMPRHLHTGTFLKSKKSFTEYWRLWEIYFMWRTVIHDMLIHYRGLSLEHIVYHSLNESMEHSTSDKPSMIFTKLSANRSPPKPTEGKPSEKRWKAAHVHSPNNTEESPHMLEPSTMPQINRTSSVQQLAVFVDYLADTLTLDFFRNDEAIINNDEAIIDTDEAFDIATNPKSNTQNENLPSLNYDVARVSPYAQHVPQTIIV